MGIWTLLHFNPHVSLSQFINVFFFRKPIVAHPVNHIFALYGTRKLITMFLFDFIKVSR